ncbi:hypothetical protein [Brumimicrobium aurantiacum]|uniref:Uncharacterized protein n=1 Tax=Brumimicrobium aurantiacum TaxID=1737063 RepID=A0A3E1EWC8_9FLAO|nr:hypothetical protein [Brumimicrobium aurantiacum]RFC53864.1 hypothetical protein DXU93_09960 [Brumimicrobium aurantiacum]
MRKTIISIILLIVGIGLLAFNRRYLFVFESDALIMYIQLLLLAVLLFSILLSFIPRLRKPLFLKTLFIFALALIFSELILAYRSVAVYNRIRFTNNYHQNNCDQLLERFEYDKTQNKFAYFSCGIAIDSEEIKQEFKEKYNVEVVAIGLGCTVDCSEHCYNLALMEYLNPIDSSN